MIDGLAIGDAASAIVPASPVHVSSMSVCGLRLCMGCGCMNRCPWRHRRHFEARDAPTHCWQQRSEQWQHVAGTSATPKKSA
eukprot:5826302-Prymnesium_polylepis.3